MMKAPQGQEHVVKNRKFTEEQIACALKQAGLGTRVEEVCWGVLSTVDTELLKSLGAVWRGICA